MTSNVSIQFCSLLRVSLLMRSRWEWHWYTRRSDLVKICWPGNMRSSPFRKCRQLLYPIIHPHTLVTWPCLLTGCHANFYIAYNVVVCAGLMLMRPFWLEMWSCWQKHWLVMFITSHQWCVCVCGVCLWLVSCCYAVLVFQAVNETVLDVFTGDMVRFPC